MVMITSNNRPLAYSASTSAPASIQSLTSTSSTSTSPPVVEPLSGSNNLTNTTTSQTASSTSPAPISDLDINSLKTTKFSLYTRRNPIAGQHIIPGLIETIQNATYYRNNNPTRIIIHGSFDGADVGHWMRNMKHKLLDVEDSNVILVDWSDAASNNNAIHRLACVRTVGHQMVRILQDMMKIKGLKGEDVHLIAHGDGTFAAAVIGKNMMNIGRISGLNPSGPGIDTMAIDERLDRSDASFVDVIHTDQQNGSFNLAAGIYKKGSSITFGDVDFYPNGGVSQPGCSIDDLDDLLRKAVSEGLKTFLSCSHYRAIDYYLESISDAGKCLHLAYECKSYSDFLTGSCGHCHDEQHLCAEMGFHSHHYYPKAAKLSRSESVKLYFNTNKRKPFCRKY